MTRFSRTAAPLGLAVLTLLGLSAARPAQAAPDIITFDNLPNEPGRTAGSTLAVANGGSPTFDGVTFSGNSFVLGDQTSNGSSPLVVPHSGNYAFAPADTPTTLTTTKTLYGLYLGLINDSNAASSVTVNALGAGGTILTSKTDALTSTTESFFDTSSFASLTGITGYSLVGSNPNNVNSNDFAGDDFTFSAPAVTPPAPVVSGTFDFESNTQGQQTTFTDTSGVINATFSAPGDTVNNGVNSGGFIVRDQFANFPGAGFSGKQLISTQANSLPLSVAFDHTLGGGSVNFASFTGPGTFTATETLNGVAVGTAIGTNSGLLNFGGVSFNGLTFTDTASAFGIDNLDVSSAPEPSQAAALAFTALGLGGLLRARKKKAQAA